MQIYQPTIIIFPDETQITQHVTSIVLDQIRAKPESVLTIATGNATKQLFPNLVEAHQKGIDFTQTTFIGLDEYYPITPNHPISTLKRTTDAFFSPVGIQPNHIIFPDGTTSDIAAAIDRFKKLLHTHPLDLAIVGIGPGKTCHIGMNNPGSTMDSETRLVELDSESRHAMMKKLNLPEADVPHNGITLGMKEILQAKKIIVIAFGENKSWGVNRSIIGTIGSEAPASFLRYHPNVIWILDTIAARLLPPSIPVIRPSERA